jgi:hypothetical protein
MISNPFFYRAADVRSGSMAEDRNFVNLFGVSALGLIKANMQNLWDLPIFLMSAPGGGKSSLMRIFSSSALHYMHETSPLGGKQQFLSKQMEELGAFLDGEPLALGIWLRMSDEYHSFSRDEAIGRNGAFFALLNARIFLSAFNGICELRGLSINRDLERITLSLKSNASNGTVKAWTEWGDESGKAFYEKMASLESDLSDMINDPFWEDDYRRLLHTSIWALDLLPKLDISIDSKPFIFRPLIMLDDAHELVDDQLKYLFSLLMSRQLEVPFWISFRKQAMGLEALLTEPLQKGVEKGRDYHLIDLEKDGRGDFRKLVLEISELRVQSVAAQIGGLSQEFVNFISDDREEILLKNLDEKVALEIKERIVVAAGIEFRRFETIISQIEHRCTEPHDLCKSLRMVEILIQREMGRSQKSFGFNEVPTETLKKHENNASIVEAAELFLAREYKLPYYFGAQRLIALSSFNIQQFLKLAGGLFEEIMTAIRLGRDRESFLSPQRQHAIIAKTAKEFLKEIPSMSLYGNKVLRFVQAIGEMCRHETYRPTAPYAPGVTGTALTMHDFETLVRGAEKGEENSIELYQTIKSAIAHNVLDPEPNYKCKGKEFLVLNLNRLLCVPFNLPLQKGGFREQKLATLMHWLKQGYKKGKSDPDQRDLWM